MFFYTLRTSMLWAVCLLLCAPTLHARPLGHPPRTLQERKINTLEVTPGRVWQEFVNRKKNSSKRVVMYCELNIYRHGDPLRLTHLALKWEPVRKGAQPPRHLSPVLYQSNRVFNPTSQAAIADGYWNPRTKTIHFDELDYKIIGRHKLYIVMLASSEDLARLSGGRFVYNDVYRLVTTPIKA